MTKSRNEDCGSAGLCPFAADQAVRYNEIATALIRAAQDSTMCVAEHKSAT